MENQPTLSKKSIMLNYGVMMGVITIVISVLNYAFGNTYDPHWSVNVVSAIAVIVIIVLGIKKLKEAQSGFLSVGDSIKTGLGITMIGALISIVYMYIFTKFIEPDFIMKIVEINRTKTLEAAPNITDEQLEVSANMTRDYFYVFTFGMIIIFNLFIGFLTGLVSGLVMKNTEED
ncbi:DUF4199 domain-containing protein [Lutimonas sp.]|uniref:DUF4199 domain-containing protein n=1 Tax=Lutimonas sp. TaxID=1872403 RepID=UPI003D9B0497